MYKDKKDSNEAAKLRMRNFRNRQKGVTKTEGVTEPVTPLPDLIQSESTTLFRALPQDVQEGILGVLRYRKVLGLFDDSVGRVEAATRYQEFLKRPKLVLQNSGFLESAGFRASASTVRK